MAQHTYSAGTRLLLKQAIGSVTPPAPAPRKTPRVVPPKPGFWGGIGKGIKDSTGYGHWGESADEVVNDVADYTGSKLKRVAQPTIDEGEAAAARTMDKARSEADKYVADLQTKATETYNKYKPMIGAGVGAAGVGGLGMMFMMLQQTMAMNQMAKNGTPQGQMAPAAQMNPQATDQALQGGVGSWRL